MKWVYIIVGGGIAIYVIFIAPEIFASLFGAIRGLIEGLSGVAKGIGG